MRGRNVLLLILIAIGLRIYQVWWTWKAVSDDDYYSLGWRDVGATTTIYVIENDLETCRTQFRFYCKWLEGACRNERFTQKMSTGRHYKNVFYFHQGNVDTEFTSLLNNISTACNTDFRSVQVFTKYNWSLSTVEGSNVVVASCDVDGPFLPKYFLGLGYSFWTDAYTSKFQHGARFVANMVNCEDGETNLVLPVAIHNSLLDQFDGHHDILSGRNLSLWFKRRQMYKSESDIQWAFLGFHAEGMNWKRLSQARVSICEIQRQTQSRSGAPHPWEGLFLETKFAKQLPTNSLRLYKDVSLRLFEESREPVPIDRTLVVVAFQEKTEECKSNMIYFLQVAVIPDDLANVPLDYIIVVSGDTTLHFPKLKNLRLMHTSSPCFDFGLWGIGLKSRTLAHTTFILLNPTVRGPFLPAWYTAHWSSSFLSMLDNKVKLIGASMKCPESSEGPLIYVLSAAMALDKIGLHMGLKAGVFDCAAQSDMQNEGHFVQVLRNAGLRVEFQLETDSKKSSTWQGNGCLPVPDAFHDTNPFHGSTPHPFELVFYTTGQKTQTPFMNFLSVQTSLSVAPKLVDSNFIVMLSHTSSLFEESSRILVELGSIMVKNGFDVRVLAPDQGPLQKELSERRVATGLLDLHPRWKEDGFDLLGLILRVFWDRLPSTVICNTLWWARALALIPPIRARSPAFVLFVHENEIIVPNWAEDSFAVYNKDRKHVVPGLLSVKSRDSWYGEPVPVFDGQDRKTFLANIDSVVFPAEASRKLWLDSDSGNFQENFNVFNNFLDFSDVHHRAGVGLHSRLDTAHSVQMQPGQQGILRTVRASVRKEFGYSENAFVMTVTGPICARKNQLALLQDGVLSLLNRYLFDQWMILVIGKMDESSSTEYLNKFLSMAQTAGLSKHVHVLPYNPADLTYTAAADLHVSVSRMEVSPLNTLEAKMLGIPVLMTPAGGSAEQMIADKIDGYLLLDFEQRSLEDALWRIFSHRDPLAAMHEVGLAGQAVALAMFTSETAEPRLTLLTSNIVTDVAKSTSNPSNSLVGIMVQLDDSESWVKTQSCLRKTLDLIFQAFGRANVYITTSFQWKNHAKATQTLYKHAALQHLLVWRSYTRSSEGRFLQQLLLTRQMRLSHDLLFRFSSESLDLDSGTTNSLCGTMGKGQSILQMFRDRSDVGMLGRSLPDGKRSASADREVKEVWKLLEMTSKVNSATLSTFDASAYWARGNLSVWSSLVKFSPRLLANMGQVNVGCQNKRCDLDVGLKQVVPTLAAMTTKVISPLKK